MRVAIVGSREYPDLAQVRQYVLDRLTKDDVLVTGGARGVDTEAERTHLGRGGTIRVLRPDWQRFGKAAGPIRNEEIVAEAERVVAFWDGKSRGTRSTIDLALDAGLPLEIWAPTEGGTE